MIPLLIQLLTVDKIIIAQESLGMLMNRLCPGVYVSVAKIDFKALDSVSNLPP